MNLEGIRSTKLNLKTIWHVSFVIKICRTHFGFTDYSNSAVLNYESPVSNFQLVALSLAFSILLRQKNLRYIQSHAKEGKSLRKKGESDFTGKHHEFLV